MKGPAQSAGVELTLGGFLFSILVADWIKPMMRPETHQALVWVIQVPIACSFGLVGALLARIPACRRPLFAHLVALASAPALGLALALGIEAINSYSENRVQSSAAHGVLMGIASAPFIAGTFLRRQVHTSLAIEEAASRRGAWATILMLLAIVQPLVAYTSEMWSLGEALRRRPDASAALGLLAVIGIGVAALVDGRVSRALQRAIERDREVEGTAVELDAYRRISSHAFIDKALLIPAVLAVVAAHMIGGPAYALHWPFGLEGW